MIRFQIKSKYGSALSSIKVGTIITLSLSNSGSFSVIVGNSDLGVMATDLPQQGIPIIDVYGSCEKVSRNKLLNEIIVFTLVSQKAIILNIQ